ncbi:MAG: hypothetical protein HFJ17_06495 [Clostridia bacterium]|jgi:hypothetical protein|nr:hypothetical protein [Clostridia bacterium]
MKDEKEIFILNELSKFNMKRCSKGFKYLSEAILICIKDPDYLDNLTKYVFPIIAKKYNEKSLLNVKWCIDQILKTMYNNTSISLIASYFNIDENLKPSLKLVIYTIVSKYEWRYN